MSNLLPSLAIIEDDDDLRENLIVFLSTQGYEAWGVNSAESFFRELAIKTVDIVLLDLGLPGENGLSVLKHLQQSSEYLFIVISACDSIEDKKSALEAGAKGYFVKPVNIQKLLTHILTIWEESKHPPQKPVLKWRLDHKKQLLFAPSGRFLPLTESEYKLLAGLMSTPGKTFSKNDVSKFLWQEQSNWRDYHGVEVLLSRLRRKCLNVLEEKLPVRSVQAIGLSFTAAIDD